MSKKYVLVGAGERGLTMYAKPLSTELKHKGTLVGIFDKNKSRASVVKDMCKIDCPVYDDFSEMIDTVKPNFVIVSTIDKDHKEYIVKSLAMNCDVITEKPMAIDIESCFEILAAERKSNGRKVIVAYNSRYKSVPMKIKQLLNDGDIGQVRNINFQYSLDFNHGAEYFRRWHRSMSLSGGLLIHKSCHHFDLVNWWLEDTPTELFAYGELHFFGNGSSSAIRCSDCSIAESCPFKFNRDPFINEMYFKNEYEDGYIRDRCVFGDDIDIFDNMSVLVKYRKGCILNYSLTCFNPYEGWRVVITGETGRIEAEEIIRGPEASSHHIIKLYKREHTNQGNTVNSVTYRLKKNPGKHDGADELLRKDLFSCHDQSVFRATSLDGAFSVIMGVCANKSIKEKRSVIIENIIRRCISISEGGVDEN